MKKLLPLFILVCILTNLNLVESVSGVYNTTSGFVYTEMVYLKTTFVNQNPTSADPGGYVDLLFKIENFGTENAENVTFELLPKYPFSLDPGESAIQELGTIKGLQRGDNAFLLRYKVKVDKDAVDGDSEIKLKYSYGSNTAYSTQAFNVTISNPRTDFEAVVQDSTDTSTTIAIANIGANTAYSTIVKIPQQEDFRVSGISASIIGNLDAGDYTLVSFQIISTNTVNISNPTGIPPTESQTGMSTDVSMSSNRNITVEISYTDTLGIRRTVQKQVPFDTTSGTTTSLARTQSSTSLLGNSNLTSSGLTYIVIGIVGIVIIVAILKIRKRKKK
jgi:hypothetical protein